MTLQRILGIELPIIQAPMSGRNASGCKDVLAARLTRELAACI